MKIYEKLKNALRKEIERSKLSGKGVSIRCRALSAEEAIGKPEHDDYPIIKGKEVMVEAIFEKSKGQAFSDEFENANYKVDDLLDIELNTNRKRASFISGINAVFRHLGICDKSIHCKDTEPEICAKKLLETIGPRKKILIVGYQPRFLEALASKHNIRVVDLDKDNVGREISGVVIEQPEIAFGAISWCDMIFATGSTVVNGTITYFLNQDVPVLFYGVTISATAKILNLNNYCYFGH